MIAKDETQLTADGFATLEQAGKFLAVSRAKLYVLMNAGAIKFAKIGRCRRLPWAELRRFAAQCLVTE
jgi:excisionase family DNA binding protein